MSSSKMVENEMSENEMVENEMVENEMVKELFSIEKSKIVLPQPTWGERLGLHNLYSQICKKNHLVMNILLNSPLVVFISSHNDYQVKTKTIPGVSIAVNL